MKKLKITNGLLITLGFLICIICITIIVFTTVPVVSGLDVTDPTNTRYMYLDQPELNTFNQFGLEIETYFNINNKKFPVMDIIFKGHPDLNWYSYTIDENKLCFEIDNNGDDQTFCHAELLEPRKWYNLSLYLDHGQVRIGINDTFTTFAYDPINFETKEPLFFGKCTYIHNYLDYCYNYRGIFKTIKVYNNGQQYMYDNSFKFTRSTALERLPDINIQNEIKEERGYTIILKVLTAMLLVIGSMSVFYYYSWRKVIKDRSG